MQLADAEVIVTGGASGLGAATARLLRECGARVHIWDCDDSHGLALARELDARYAHVDVARTETIAAALESVVAPRALVNCAGIGRAAKVLGRRGPHPLELFQQVIAVNLVGSFDCARQVAAKMARCEPDAEGERGVIVHVSSALAFEGRSSDCAYAASKAGVLGMVLPMARDLAAYGIRCNAIAPGLFDTPMLAQLPDDVRAGLIEHVPFPQRLGRAEEFARFVKEVCENRMLNGAVIRLDGALRNPAH
jgi:NAD(P)-dependent dehydrogenase (short-subunit alcohol dehydrogenase family)